MYLQQVRFAHVLQIGSLSADLELVVALLQRWTPETHIFHLPTGECPITLEDIRMLFSLHINSKAVNGPTQVASDVYMENLGVEPSRACKNRASVKITWFQEKLE